MARKAPKGPKTVVAFKVESDLADLLNKLPNKSAFIRKAITAQLGLACPLCHGKGVVPRGIHDHYAPVVKRHGARDCDSCGQALPLPANSDELSEGNRARFEQFFLGGPLYCEGCFGKMPPCEDCGWHVDAAQIADHLRKAHLP